MLKSELEYDRDKPFVWGINGFMFTWCLVFHMYSTANMDPVN